MIRHAHQLAREIEARAVVVYADALSQEDELRDVLRSVDFPTILVARDKGETSPFQGGPHTWVTVPNIHMTRAGQVKVALLVCLAKGVLQRGDRVVCLSGIDGSNTIDALIVLNLGTESELFSALNAVTIGGGVTPAVFERALTLATQLAVEGREGRPVGALFVLGDSESVLAQSRSLILNPFHGYPEEDRNILDPELEETIKEFAALDGAFIIRGDGVVLTAGSQLMPAAPVPALPKGLGTRHAAAAAITASTGSVSLAISQSTGTVTVFKSGQMITDIHKPVNGNRLMV
jgi:DNA integrity scanning protein DisA with diadenylate cyclase activity